MDTEFLAALFETIEIKRIWPIYNKSQKHYEHQYGIFMFEDNKGYLRLGIDKKRKILKPLMSFSMVLQAHNTLWAWSKQYNIHPSLCFLDKRAKNIDDLPSVNEHNNIVTNLVKKIEAEKETYFIQEASSYIFIENGMFYGMGKVLEKNMVLSKNTLKVHLTQYPENEILKNMLKKYILKHPEKMITI